MRNWPIPRKGNTIHLVGDTQSVSSGRQQIILDDMPRMPAVAHRLQVGDLVGGTGDPTWFPPMVDFMDSLGTGQWWCCVGNHDYDQSDQDPPPSDAPPLMGMPGLDFTVDLGYAVVLVTYVRAAETYDPAPYDTTWLDETLAANADRTCLILAHAPLITDTEPNGAPAPETPEISAVLDKHPQAKAWLCGHSHDPINGPYMIENFNTGTRTIAHVNASALYYTSPDVDWNDPLYTLYVTVLDDGRIEVRFRNHGAHQWVGGGEQHTRRWVSA